MTFPTIPGREGEELRTQVLPFIQGWRKCELQRSKIGLLKKLLELLLHFDFFNP